MIKQFEAITTDINETNILTFTGILKRKVDIQNPFYLCKNGGFNESAWQAQHLHIIDYTRNINDGDCIFNIITKELAEANDEWNDDTDSEWVRVIASTNKELKLPLIPFSLVEFFAEKQGNIILPFVEEQDVINVNAVGILRGSSGYYDSKNKWHWNVLIKNDEIALHFPRDMKATIVCKKVDVVVSITQPQDDSKENWVFERSSGYAGYRNTETMDWIYIQEYNKKFNSSKHEEGISTLRTTVLPKYNCSNCENFIHIQAEKEILKSKSVGFYAMECSNCVHPLLDCVLQGFKYHSAQSGYDQTLNK